VRAALLTTLTSRMSSRRAALIVATSAALCSVALSLDRSMHFFLERDSGVFLYTARRVLSGGLPYRDVWDHKPPLIYYIDALGVALSDWGVPGVALLEFVALLVATVLGVVAVARVVGLVPALAAAGAWSVTLPILLDGGNLPEEFALPLQFAAIALYLSSSGTTPNRTAWTALGVAAALALLLKPTVLGIFAAIYLCEGARAFRTRSLSTLAGAVLFGIVGGLAVIVPVGLFIATSDTGADFFDQVLRYNAVYGAVSGSERLAALGAGLRVWTLSGLLPVALVGWAIAVSQLVRGSVAGVRERLFLLAAIALPLEFVLASAPGRDYPQYFIPALPAMSLLVAITVASVRDLLQRMPARTASVPRTLLLAVLGIAVVPFATASLALALERQERGASELQVTRRNASAYVTQHTDATQSVLFWGGEAGLNYTSGRRSPTRFAYQYALFLRDYQNVAQVDELLAQLLIDPPTLIVDASASDARVVAPLSANARLEWRPSDRRYGSFTAVERIFAWVEAQYRIVDQIAPLGWRVYARRDGSGR
jgi:hypothetical protein